MSWLFLLGGMLVWGAHFGGVYLLSSVGHAAGDAAAQEVRLGVAALTSAAAIANLALLVAASVRERRLREDEFGQFWNGAAALGALLSLVAVLWQGLPALTMS